MARIGNIISDLWRPAGATNYGALPLRVSELVSRRDRQSEHLLCAVQLLLAATLACLYTIAPKPPDASMTHLAPAALALYVILIVFRIWVIAKRPLPRCAVAFSIVLDMMLLLWLIWSFHWTYGQPAAFSLKAPTFVYIFVFIAVRALRFDYRYVLMAGFAAASGWILLTAAAVFNSPPGTITHNFSSYILANRILIGAEFDKIFAIACVTSILGLTTWRAEKTLVQAVREQVANREISRFLSHGIADQIANSATEIEAGEATERLAAIMFLDIRGFTRIAMSVPPKALVDILTSFHARVVPIVHAHDGVVDKFLGDGVMITFGASRPSDRPVANALWALEELLGAFSEWQTDVEQHGLAAKLRVNAAVASGRVVFAALGDTHRLEYTVIGEAVNLAAKLEKQNKVESTLALSTLETFDLARAQGFAPALQSEIRMGVGTAGVDGMIDLVCWAETIAR